MTPQASPLDINDFWELVFRHKWKLLLFPLAVFALAALVILFAPRTYQSQAKLLLRLGRESVGMDPLTTTGQTISVQKDGRDSEVQSAMDLLASRGMAEKVVDLVGVDYVLNGGPVGSGERDSAVADYVMAPVHEAIELVRSIDAVSPKERAVILFGKSLQFDAERNSTVINVSYETDSPEGAQHILEALVNAYKEEYLHLYRYSESGSFFADQKQRLLDQLNDANAKLRDAKNRMGLATVEGRRQTYESQVSSIEQTSYNAEQEFASAQARISDLRQQLADLPERLVMSKTRVPNAGADLLREQLYSLQVRQADLKARYHDDHPLVQAVSAQVQEASRVMDQQQELREETVDDVNPIHRELTVELRQQENLAAGVSAKLKTLEEQKRLVMSDLKQLNRDEVTIRELERDAELAESKFRKYSDNFEQARIDQALEDQRISSVNVPQHATLQEKPVSPSKLLVALAAVALSFGGTASWVIGSEKLNNKVRTRSEAERSLGVPVYAAIPKQAIYSRVLAN